MTLLSDPENEFEKQGVIFKIILEETFQIEELKKSDSQSRA